MKLNKQKKIYKRKIGRKTSNIWKFNTLLNNSWVKEKVSREIKSYSKFNKKGKHTFSNVKCSKSGVEREM